MNPSSDPDSLHNQKGLDSKDTQNEAMRHFSSSFILHPCIPMPKSTRNIGLSELRVGLLVFIALAVLLVLILNASGALNPFKSHLHLRARFADANGLREGSEVRLAGVRIGKVDRIRLLSPSEVGTGPSPQKMEASLTLYNKF